MPRRRLCLAGFYLDMFAILEFGIFHLFVCLFIGQRGFSSSHARLRLALGGTLAAAPRLTQRREPSSIPRAIFRISLSGSRAARQLPARLELFNVGS